MNVHFSSATDLHSTPQEFFDKLNAEFGFTLDVCATSENAKCESYYTKQDDGLAQPWRGNVWMNPPYGREIGRWMEKANEAAKEGATVVCLVPARTDTRWWHECAIQHEVRFIRGAAEVWGCEEQRAISQRRHCDAERGGSFIAGTSRLSDGLGATTQLAKIWR